MNIKKYFTIINRIASGYAISIAIVCGITILSILILSKDRIISEEIPMLPLLKDLNSQILDSKILTEKFIDTRNNADKEALTQLQSQYYPTLRGKITELNNAIEDQAEHETYESYFNSYDSIIASQHHIIQLLAAPSDSVKDARNKALSIFNNEITPKTNKLIRNISEFTSGENKYMQSMVDDQQEDTDLLKLLLLGMLGAIIFVAIGIYVLTIVIIDLPLRELKKIILALSKGEVQTSEKLKKRDSLLKGYKTDEIGQMATAIEDMLVGVKRQIIFAEEIGKGNYDQEFAPLSDKDTMGLALIDMRNNLKKVADEDRRRNWAIEGLAKFAEMLRKNNDNVKELSNEIISNLVVYLKANQGGLFIVNETYSDDVHLELMSCYAFERKKHITKKIGMGEGLVGQAWQEGQYIYITDVPNEYVHITSGLGGTNPRCILIMPLKINETILGILEIASFNVMEQHEIDFVQKLSESIASTISTTKTNERTKRLLQESQQQSEELKTQEEEMRQTMEEMTATQEEMERKENDYLSQIEVLKNK